MLQSYFVGIRADNRIVLGFQSENNRMSEAILTISVAKEIVKLLETSIEILEKTDESNKADDSGKVREGPA